MNQLPNEIINNIYNIFDKLKDKSYFIQINKNTNKLLQYDFNKLYIEETLNNDYLQFYKLLNKYDYDMDYLNSLLIKTTEKILTVWGNRSCGFYDMRFIFELMYKGCIQSSYINHTAKHFYRYFYNDIKNCIVYNDRQITLINIENSKNLLSLKNKFNYYKHGEYKNKPYIKLISF